MRARKKDKTLFSCFKVYYFKLQTSTLNQQVDTCSNL